MHKHIYTKQQQTYPWDNSANNTKRFVTSVAPLVMGGVNGLAVNLISPTSKVAEAGNGIGNINITSNSESLAVVKSIKSSQFILVTLHQISELVDQTTTFSRSNLAPGLVVALVGSSNSGINVLGISRVNRANDFLSGRVDSLDQRTMAGNKLVVDEQLGVDYEGGGCSLRSITRMGVLIYMMPTSDGLAIGKANGLEIRLGLSSHGI